MFDEPGISGIIYVVLIIVIDVVYSRECYNFREEPKVRDCPHGCCGEDYAEYCCDATLQIVGSAIGAALVLGAIIAGIYYCYQKKRSKRRMARGGQQNRTFVTRFGFRTRPANVGVQQDQQGPNGSRQRPRIQAHHAVPHQIHLNPAYLNTIQGQNGGHFNYPGINSLGPPTAPMPPPYSMSIAPPPYTDAKPIPPPPEYNSVVHGMPPGYKYGNSSNSMPPPSS